jgi:hypothetical protein
VLGDLFAGPEKREEVDVCVVGSGISGSTTAFYLNKKGIKTMLTEGLFVVCVFVFCERGRGREGEREDCYKKYSLILTLFTHTHTHTQPSPSSVGM